MQNDPLEIIKGILLGCGIAIIVYFFVFKPTFAEIKAYSKRIQTRLKHPFKRVFQYKTDHEILLGFSLTDWVKMRTESRGGSASNDWGIGNKPPDWWIGESGRDNNSMLH